MRSITAWMITAERAALGIPESNTVSVGSRRRQGCRLTIEGSSEGVESDDDDNTSHPSGEGSANTGLGLDGGSREGTRRGVGTEESTDRVGNSNSDELLVGVNLVVVDTSET